MSEKITIGKCKDCKYFEPDIGDEEGFGSCSHPKHIYHECFTEETYPSDALLIYDAECYSAFIDVGPDFGCIHFEPKNPENKEVKNG